VARLLFRQGKTRESIPFFEKAAGLLPNDWHSPLMLTSCYRSTGNEADLQRVVRSGLERAERAVAKDPTNAQALAAGASALALLGEERRARDWIDRALLLDPDNAGTRYNLACALLDRLDDREKAIEVLGPYFEQTIPNRIKHLEADPDMDPIRDDPRFKDMLAAAKQRLGMADSPVASAKA